MLLIFTFKFFFHKSRKLNKKKKTTELKPSRYKMKNPETQISIKLKNKINQTTNLIQ